MPRLAPLIAGLNAFLVLVSLAACGTSSSGPSPIVDPNTIVTPLEHSGSVGMTFVTATVAPGGTIAGCGPLVEGCRDRLRMTINLQPAISGPVLFSRVYLHATNQIACLWGETGAMTLAAKVPTMLVLPADRADRCGVPLDIVSMDVVIEGPNGIASRQVWTIHYHLVP